MDHIEGAIYADGTGPDTKKVAGGNSSDSPPSYSQYPSQGYGGYSYGGNAYSQMMPSAPPCDSRDGSTNLSRGHMTIQWANAAANMPMGKFLDTSPGVQDNFMAWGGDPSHKYTAPVPSPAEDSCSDTSDSSDDEEDKKCRGPSCPRRPKALKHIKKVVDKNDKGREKWMCKDCRRYECGSKRTSQKAK